MSQITLSYFAKLRLKMMEQDSEYQKGYEYANSLLPYWSKKGIDELIDALRGYVSVAVRDSNTCAMGHAQALREIIWERLQSEVLQSA